MLKDCEELWRGGSEANVCLREVRASEIGADLMINHHIIILCTCSLREMAFM